MLELFFSFLFFLETETVGPVSYILIFLPSDSSLPLSFWIRQQLTVQVILQFTTHGGIMQPELLVSLYKGSITNISSPQPGPREWMESVSIIRLYRLLETLKD